MLPSPICSWASAFTGREGSIIEAIDLAATELHPTIIAHDRLTTRGAAINYVTYKVRA